MSKIRVVSAVEYSNVAVRRVMQNNTNSLRDPIDGSFIVYLNEPTGKFELAQRIIDYADAKGLSIDKKIAKAKSGDALIFGGPGFDVTFIKASDVLRQYYVVTHDFPTIIEAIRDLSEEFDTFKAKYVVDCLKGNRDVLPVYSEFKAMKTGQKVINTKKEENLTNELNEFASRLLCNGCRYQQPKKETENILVSYNFIKVGRNYIPVNDNQKVVITV